jgi:nicotinate phosphoribosyltransferase
MDGLGYQKMFNEKKIQNLTDKDLPIDGGGISTGLDYYKPTMSQLAYEKEPDVHVTFTFHNRGEQRLLDYVDIEILRQHFANLQTKGWTPGELRYLASIKMTDGQTVFQPAYIDYLQTHELPIVEVRYDEKIDDLAIVVTGPWAISTFWETIVMSVVNEVYFEGYVRKRGLNLLRVYDEGNQRLSEKIAVLKANPDIKLAEFGTRRHFSFLWQKHVLERLLGECPENVVGTSNVALAASLGIKPIGTFAHEMPMVYAALADARGEDIRASHRFFLQDWFSLYGEDHSIALTDTFRTDFFFSDLTLEQAMAWRGVRQDSGDPFRFGERLIQFYKDGNIDPQTKTVIFSDGLDIETIVALSEHFLGRINVLFGWGTTLTNDLGIRALNVVMKATHVKISGSNLEADTVKLSDTRGKHTGPISLVKEYEERHFAVG